MSDLISFADCYVQHGAAGDSMLTERCPARTRPCKEHVRGPMMTAWEIYAVGRWRRLYSDNGHFLLVDRKRVPVTIVLAPPHMRDAQQLAMTVRP